VPRLLGQLHENAAGRAHRGRPLVAHGQVPTRLGVQLHRDPLLHCHLRGEFFNFFPLPAFRLENPRVCSTISTQFYTALSTQERSLLTRTNVLLIPPLH